MAGAETHGSDETPTDGAAPVSSPFRETILWRIKVWRSLRAPTEEQLERLKFWEEYLAKSAPEPRAQQAPAIEPIQKR